MSILEIEGLRVDFTAPSGEVQCAVRGVDLAIARGEVLALVGESGSGKSVTAAAILGLLPERGVSARGAIRFEGRSLLGRSETELNQVRGHGIGIIFQNSLSSLDPSFRVGDQLCESLRFRQGLRGKAAWAAAHAWLERVRIRDVARVLAAYPHELSGGMRQRVMIALAMLGRPRLLIADEPTTALDPTIQKEILQLLSEINTEEGTAMLLITHDFGVVAALADRVAVMREGEIVETGVTGALLAAPTHPYTQRLVASVPGARPAVPAPADRPRTPRPRAGDAGAPLVSLEGISRRYPAGTRWLRPAPSVQALAPVDLSIRRGEILGLIGESGSGKSTLARVAARLVDASTGIVRVAGEDVTALRGAALAPLRRQVQVVFQDGGASLNPRRTVGAQLIAPLLRLGAAQSFAQARSLAIDALERVGLSAQHLNRYPHEFSGGQRQRIGIARALAPRPAFVILDEPTSALDVSIQAQVLDLLRELRRELSLTYLFIGHDLAVIESLCDRIAVMEQGHIVEVFDRDCLRDPGRHPATRRLLDAVLPVQGAFRLGRASLAPAHSERAAA
ncbi:dipeptide ABC transporter ATP-binding protein [Achromobacter ruhlandii]|uniref:Glutathione import ATP-binding protein GsiA n=1 Tax=Achromobacter ruhlandii TaxID=72557 RepID=A0A2M9H316_9BURK|nr:ABC transporter ATP-binding protein [Achromobacter ruhlandii]PJM71197.1 ABC transporter ATP-binding protein [Achromobacter ruhlandii]CAB3864231.1 Glutathione import ATP-binding protein GsiA [Achromobacter ruhlandii]